MAESLHTPQSCILFATADWSEQYWTNKQHCAQSLADLGIRVLFIESIGLRNIKPYSYKDWSRLWNRLCNGLYTLILGDRRVANGIYVLSPLQIPAGHHKPIYSTINRFLLKSAISLAIRRRKLIKPLIWTYHPFMLEVIEGMNNSGLLYHCVDDLAFMPGLNAQAFRLAEKRLLIRADIVFVTAMTLLHMCRKLNRNTHYLPNVVDLDHFGKAFKEIPIPPDLNEIPEPRLVYHGVLSDFKIDFELLLSCVKNQPAWQWVFIGEEPEGQHSSLFAELSALPNVHCLGYKDYEVLPNYLRGMQVGLLPSLNNNYTRSMFPMKYFEYLAAGLPVVSTRLAFTESNSEGIVIGDDPEQFISAIKAQLAAGRLTIQQAQEFVGENTWKNRTSKMLKTLLGSRKD